MFNEDTPYTIMNEGRHQLDWAARAGNERFIRDYHELREKALNLFGRKGPHFDFAPTPMICSSKVWRAMYEKIAKPLEKVSMIKSLDSHVKRNGMGSSFSMIKPYQLFLESPCLRFGALKINGKKGFHLAKRTRF